MENKIMYIFIRRPEARKEPLMKRTLPAASMQAKAVVLSKAVVNAAELLKIPKAKLAQIVGVSPATITRLYSNGYVLAQDRKEWEFAVLLVRLFRSLDSIVGGVTEDARQWLASENRAFAGRKPINVIESTEGLVRVVNYLDAYRAVI
jgi:uncharacterized protein (DUF2384 family)